MSQGPGGCTFCDVATDYRVLVALAKISNLLEDMRRATASSSVDEPVRLVINNQPIIEQGAAATMQIHDNEQFDITVDAEDSKGAQVSDTFTVTSSDTTIVSVVAGADGKTFTLVAGLPGSAVVTVTDGLLSATESVDVVSGTIAKIALVEGTATTQPAAPATPAGP